MNRSQLIHQIQLKQSYLCVGLDTDIEKIIQSFESGDTLEPLRYLSQFKESDSAVFLVEEPLHEKIKTQVTYAIGIIPVVLTIIDRAVKL